MRCSLGFDGIEDDFHAGHDTPLRQPRAVVSARHRNAQRAATVDRRRRRTRAGRRAHGHCRDQAGMDRRQSGHRRRAAAVDAAGRHAAVLRERRHAQGRRAERAVPDRRQIHRRTCRDGRRDRRRAAVSQGRQAPARAGRLGREAGHDHGRARQCRCGCRSSGSIGGERWSRRHRSQAEFGCSKPVGDLGAERMAASSRDGLRQGARRLQISSSSGSSSRVARQRVSTSLVSSITKKRAESRS